MAFLKRKKPSFEGEGLALFTDVEGARSIFDSVGRSFCYIEGGRE
ncbi:MAG TPA: hypothetical protein VJ441_01820 [Dehalococcoidia bacterium]|nr:hypothetical protein [Dehalococcoidia bacterium]